MLLCQLRPGLLVLLRIAIRAHDRPSALIVRFSSHETQRAHQPSARFDRKRVPPSDDQAAELTHCLGRTALRE